MVASGEKVIDFIRRSPFTATGILSLGFLLSMGLATAPVAAAPENLVAPATMIDTTTAMTTVELSIDGAHAATATTAKTVGALLDEHGVLPNRGDFLNYKVDDAVVPGMTVVFRRAHDVTIVAGKQRREIRSAAGNVDELLRDRRISLAAHDRIVPSVTAPLSEGMIVRIARGPRTHSWTTHVRETVSVPTIRRFVSTIPHGKSQLIASGDRGERELTVRYVEVPGARTQRAILSARIIRAPKPRIIAVGRLESFARVAERGITSAMREASSALRMIATAYIGGGGYAANGSRAGFGIVAVDPALIPLGTKLFIPGYGKAVAGDTGGAIHGHRIDLGMNRLADAVNFGTRAIKVYVLR